jgi:hypothetical protein
VRKWDDYFSVLNLGADFTSPNITDLQNDGTGYNYGAELTLEKFYDRGYYFLYTASVFESKYRGSDGVLRNTAFNGNYVLNLLGGKEWKIGERHTLIVDFRGTYSGGKRYIPVDLTASRLSRRVTHEFSVDVQNVTRNLNVFQQAYDLTSGQLNTEYQLRFFVIPQYRILF